MYELIEKKVIYTGFAGVFERHTKSGPMADPEGQRPIFYDRIDRMIRVAITPAAYAAIARQAGRAFGPPFLVRDVTIVTALVRRPSKSSLRPSPPTGALN